MLPVSSIYMGNHLVLKRKTEGVGREWTICQSMKFVGSWQWGPLGPQLRGLGINYLLPLKTRKRQIFRKNAQPTISGKSNRWHWGATENDACLPVWFCPGRSSYCSHHPLQVASTSQLSVATTACRTVTDGLRGPGWSQGGQTGKDGSQLEKSTPWLPLGLMRSIHITSCVYLRHFKNLLLSQLGVARTKWVVINLIKPYGCA